LQTPQLVGFRLVAVLCKWWQVRADAAAEKAGIDVGATCDLRSWQHHCNNRCRLSGSMIARSQRRRCHISQLEVGAPARCNLGDTTLEMTAVRAVSPQPGTACSRDGGRTERGSILAAHCIWRCSQQLADMGCVASIATTIRNRREIRTFLVGPQFLGYRPWKDKDVVLCPAR